jgi:hypothetical protein
MSRSAVGAIAGLMVVVVAIGGRLFLEVAEAVAFGRQLARQTLDCIGLVRNVRRIGSKEPRSSGYCALNSFQIFGRP